MAKKTVLSAIIDIFSKVPPVVTADLTGQTVVVVGANTGIGFETAKHFAGMNPGKLVLGCRSEEKGKAAVERIKQETGFKDVELRLIDLAKFSSVIAFADSFKDEARLDILVMNAAVAIRESREVTSDGWEQGIQVNNLSTSLTTLLLVPKMDTTAKTYGGKPRIVVVSSDLHYWSKIDDADLDAESSFRAISDNSDPGKIKVLNVFFTRSLSHLLSSTPILISCINPSYCKSELHRNVTGLFSLVGKITDALIARTSEQGSRQVVWGAVGDIEGSVVRAEGAKREAAYVNLSKVVEPSDFVMGEEGKKRGEKLWADLVRELSKVDGRVAEIVRQYS